MLRDFLRFLRYTGQALHKTRGVGLLLLMIILICAIIASIAENLPFNDAIYMTAITALTIGYGDITPATPIGRFVSIVAGITGVVFVGLVVAIANHAVALTIQDKNKKKHPGSDH